MIPAWLRTRIDRRRLNDPGYEYLFEPNTSGEVVCFDCETTGLDPRKAEILSIGAVKIKDNRILLSQRLELYMRPSGVIASDSIKIHHLRHVDLMDAMDPAEGIRQFIEFIGNRTLVGYYLEFDVAMVNKYLRPWLGIRLPNRQIEVSSIYHDIKIGHIPTQPVDLRFDSIMKALDLPMVGKHDALNDALMTAMIYVKLQNLRAGINRD